MINSSTPSDFTNDQFRKLKTVYINTALSKNFNNSLSLYSECIYNIILISDQDKQIEKLNEELNQHRKEYLLGHSKLTFLKIAQDYNLKLHDSTKSILMEQAAEDYV